jgi:hypothetical protein
LVIDDIITCVDLPVSFAPIITPDPPALEGEYGFGSTAALPLPGLENSRADISGMRSPPISTPTARSACLA